ncbi:transcriptional regulator, TrmB [Haloterrigena turkmenica DSM 5511]|uniref:Transcriptional regulator, TrmB n=1 Tax=Haloterrigena turkmenica (strain ATCC 51198 / DSM 5511 / JCM 9101 / NCIMB 13204 / VKM B-1734 / 4k) TaxID=543526 RepID=D2RT94_HALTV|nr:helix-turn-helix domain-containing protein [Haloterrigena turkmenica]ADB60974.1 transcriptional regulator, TrmB [Haloterrigena turkmenica DSM 5511]
MALDDTDERREGDASGRPRDDSDDPFDESALESGGEDPAEPRDEGDRAAAVEEVDGRIVDLLSWILDTETRAKIYVHLLANPGSTSEEVATGTGLYPSTVREALAELHDEERVNREKRASEGAGNNPYEYTAIQPSELVGGVVDQVQQELNTIFTLDRLLDRRGGSAYGLEGGNEPVTITVDDTEPPEPAATGASETSRSGSDDTTSAGRDADSADPADEDDATESSSDPGPEE